jgi:spore germination protein YaaH
VFAFLSSSAGGEELAHLRRFGARVDVVAPNWYALALPAGTVSGGPHPQVIAMVRASGVELWPVLNATLEPGADITDSAVRARVAAAAAAEAAANGYDGITLDIEQLPAGSSSAFTALVASVAGRLHAQHDHLAVYVPRRTSSGGDHDYDWKALARYADLLLASGYNEHSSTSAPGPVTTDHGWSAMLDYAAGISRRSVAPALGAFGYSWPPSGPGQLISSVDAERLRRQSGAVAHTVGGDQMFRAGPRVIYYQDAQMLGRLAWQARLHQMRWLALFSLGREPEAFWAHIRTARQAAAVTRRQRA